MRRNRIPPDTTLVVLGLILGIGVGASAPRAEEADQENGTPAGRPGRTSPLDPAGRCEKGEAGLASGPDWLEEAEGFSRAVEAGQPVLLFVWAYG